VDWSSTLDLVVPGSIPVEFSSFFVCFRETHKLEGSGFDTDNIFRRKRGEVKKKIKIKIPAKKNF